MRSRRCPRLLPLLAALVLGLALAGCASIPTSGPVVAGPAGEGDAVSGLQFQPASPAADAGPRAIVRGFLLAASGVEEDHAAARAYLGPAAADGWRAGTGTTVLEGGTVSLTLVQGGEQLAADAEPSRDGGEVTATVTADVVAVVDDGGRYAAQPPGTRHEMQLTLRAVEGQWRIAELPDGLVIDEAGFDLAFSPFQLYFVDPTTAFLVPETRWFPERRSIATTLVTQLLLGPSPWLAPAVRSGFPPGSRLTAPAAVTVEDGEALVDLTRTALQAPAADRSLMQAQLQATLRPVPSVSTVRLTVESGQLVLPDTVPPLTRDPGVDPVPVLVAGGEIVELVEGALVPVADLPAAGPGPSDPGKGPASYVALAAERSQLLHLVPGTDAGAELLLTGADLTAPSVDPLAWVWSTAAASTGVVTAVRPGVGVAEAAAPWLAGRRVTSLRVSRDGTRVLVTSTAPDGRGHVDLAGVERGRDGRPVALTPAPTSAVAPRLVEVTEAVWTGEATVAVLGRAAQDAGPRVFLTQPLGQLRTVEPPVAGRSPVVALAGGPGERSLLTVTADGGLWQRAGSQWLRVETGVGVRDPAFAG